ncbi:hypothetical protein K491DRAFT_718033 [Lophiostoma macrostomum CBS 122681]|uniref:Complex I intermediate-associated protein-like protein 84 n=1 Tax=Lophiostoma macrostomum CBS 122681 TaxID=1314788 RepID=A0A6A6T0X9_9PLEO|nr:hypothetical protein K491DRAFT_718033 [Lophiostoma macrostomum CBS 122681]
MPSHLTRVVFRSIIANRPLLYRGCLHRPARPRLTLHNAVQAPLQTQRRAFFNFLRPRKAKQAELPPGMEKMSQLKSSQRTGQRPPPPEEIAHAFSEFFQNQTRYEDFHIQLAQYVYLYLRETPREDAQPWISEAGIRKVFGSLVKPPESGGQAHLEFGRLLHEEVVKRREADAAATPKTPTDVDIQFIKVMCLYGATQEAREFASQKFLQQATADETRSASTVWTDVLRGFARGNKPEELLATTKMLRQQSHPFTRNMQNVLVAFYTDKADLQQAKKWFSEPAVDSEDPESEQHVNTNAAILKTCALNGDLAFGQQVVASLVKDVPDKAAWDAVFVWSAAIGKGVDEVDRMMGVMIRRSEEAARRDPHCSTIYPDIDTINALVDVAISKKDPYTAERFVSLGQKRGILPDAKTFTMQMQYRLSVDDVDGARAAYYGLQGAKDEKSVEVGNQLVRAMCISKQHEFDNIMAIVDDLHEARARFHPETVAALSVLHLRRGETKDAVDLLQVHAHHYSPSQRQVIRDLLTAFLLDRQNSTTDAWDTYQILRVIFPEITREVRIRMMNEFFARGRPDMACHVFFHMRNNTHQEWSANRDVYVAALTGFARSRDAESLSLVHSQLKLDLSVETDTKLRNALMLAFTSTNDSQRALDFWHEIAASKEGPTYSSIAIVFRACETLPFGDSYAEEIWRRLKENGVDIDRQIFTGYLCAMGANHQFDECVALLTTVEEEYGFAPDVSMLASWFNATANIERQRWVEKWIREHHPAMWTEIEALGHKVTHEGFGHRLYNIDRNLEP